MKMVCIDQLCFNSQLQCFIYQLRCVLYGIHLDVSNTNYFTVTYHIKILVKFLAKIAKLFMRYVFVFCASIVACKIL